MPKNGNKTIMTEELIAKLFEGFAYGLTDEEACLFVGINPQTLYNYAHKTPGFTEKKELAKNSPKMRSKLNLVNSIKDGDVDNSKWYLERKAKDEFSLKQEVSLENKDNKPFEVNVTIV